jgi:peroxiredoxin
MTCRGRRRDFFSGISRYLKAPNKREHGIMTLLKIKRMMKDMGPSPVRLFLLIALAACCSACSSPKGAPPTLESGSPAPQFTLELIGGGQVTLDTYKGKPLVLIYMASWCPCSHESAPVFKEVYEEYHPEGVEFLMLGMQDSKSKFTKFVKKKGFKFSAGFDKGDRIARLYGVSAPPTTFFIDSEGKVLSSFYGKIVERDRLAAWVDEIL